MASIQDSSQYSIKINGGTGAAATNMCYSSHRLGIGVAEKVKLEMLTRMVHASFFIDSKQIVCALRKKKKKETKQKSCNENANFIFELCRNRKENKGRAGKKIDRNLQSFINVSAKVVP
jgi:hypothetical protein